MSLYKKTQQDNRTSLVFGKRNYQLFILSIAVVALGFILMMVALPEQHCPELNWIVNILLFQQKFLFLVIWKCKHHILLREQ